MTIPVSDDIMFLKHIFHILRSQWGATGFTGGEDAGRN